VEYPLAPELPCPYPPGSEEKIACLTLRRQRGLPLFLPGDAQGARKLSDALPSTAGHSPIERRIVQVIGPRPLPAKALAARTGDTLGQRFYRALTLLAQAGVVEHITAIFSMNMRPFTLCPRSSRRYSSLPARSAGFPSACPGRFFPP
jgi:hypothetical protein